MTAGDKARLVIELPSFSPLDWSSAERPVHFDTTGQSPPPVGVFKSGLFRSSHPQDGDFERWHKLHARQCTDDKET